MFDEPKNQPEDIFAADDKDKADAPTPTPAPAPATPPPAVPVAEAALPPPPFAKASGDKQPPVQPPPAKIPPKKPMPETMPSAGSDGAMKAIIIVVVVVVVVAAAALFSYLLLGQSDPESDLVIDDDVVNIEDLQEPEEDSIEIIIPTPEPAPAVDTDRDGLTDLQEAEIGTNIKVADTDADGLSDYEEVNTWKTDPLDPDTDGDSFIDGAEVSSGYDPNGDGKLMELPE